MVREYRKWSDEDDSYLRANAHKPISELASYLGRPNSHIKTRRGKLGLTGTHRKPFTKSECDFIIKNNHLTAKELGEIFNRRQSTIYKKAQSLGIELAEAEAQTNWTKEHTQFVLDNPHLTLTEIANILGKSTSNVQYHLDRLNVETSRRFKTYTAEECKFLADNPNIPIAELSTILGRSEVSVKIKRYRLGITRTQ